MDNEFELDSRLRQLEREVAAMGALLARNAELLDDIRTYINRPVDWAQWITAGLSGAAAIGGILWAFWVQPLEIQVKDIQDKLEVQNAYIKKHVSRSLINLNDAGVYALAKPSEGRPTGD